MEGKVVGVYPEPELMDALLREIDKILVENGQEPYWDKAPKLSHEGQLTPDAPSLRASAPSPVPSWATTA